MSLSLQHLRRTFFRLYSTSNTTLSPWDILREKAAHCKPTEAELNIIRNIRPFAQAEEISCQTVYKIANNELHKIYMEWIGKPDLNVCITLEPGTSRYRADVYGVYYALVWANYQKQSYISLYSPNEIVVKCANGLYNVKAEKALYNKIQSRVNCTNDILRARLAFLTPALMKEKGILKTKEHFETFSTYSEEKFRDMMAWSTSGFPYLFLLIWLCIIFIPGYFQNLHGTNTSNKAFSITSPKKTIVETTGYTFKKPDGRLAAKYGIFFGHKDKRNEWREVPEQNLTYIGARIYALVKALEQINPEQTAEVTTDFKFDMPALEALAKYKFVRNGHPVRNANLLEKLYQQLHGREDMVTFKFNDHHIEGETNPVTMQLLNSIRFDIPNAYEAAQFIHKFNEGESLDASGNRPSISSENWPIIYAKGRMYTTKKGFKSASFSAAWLNQEHPATSKRAAIFPVTEFRAELLAIEEALKQAKENKKESIVVVTSCENFMKHWKNSWKTSNGDDVANKYIYERIRHLAVNGSMNIQFRYESVTNTAVWNITEEKCAEALMAPLNPRDRSRFDADIEDFTSIKCKDVERGKKVRRVRHFKRGTDLPAGMVWEIINAPEEQKTYEALSGGFAENILSMVKKAKDEGVNQLIIRTNSSKLIEDLEFWMPRWKQIGWRNSNHILVADWKKWEEIDQLRENLQLYFEYMNPPTEEDVQELTNFVQKKRRRRNKDSEPV